MLLYFTFCQATSKRVLLLSFFSDLHTCTLYNKYDFKVAHALFWDDYCNDTPQPGEES
jgi:hypothetical protein